MRSIVSWFWPGLITIGLLTVLAGWFLAGPIDERITAAATTALEAQPWASVEVDGRDLILKGVAPSPEDLAAAVRLADETPGVRIVDNQTTLLQLADPFTFAVTKSDDGVLLSGNVPYGDMRARVLDAAELAMPGIEILDELAVARGAPADFLDMANFALVQAAQLINGEIEISGSVLTIRGAVANAAARASVTEALQAGIPGQLSQGDINLTVQNSNGG
ncbi:BON domain-containing protein [Phyllobacterium sp. 21LDTY02-6]|uniref:BON domain-containing protein n=1 Tax=Phyllobacterium sp. 21LDTY02-6 TaxID=2944903 RepID=UPI0020214EB4|nr:BON domain-containing protein [Phyllobacterium sp. 21LDTY02-6]MCO4319830.1 BON domain-containing protein [Phyllobacterium sp. 21LDTY02-6]